MKENFDKSTKLLSSLEIGQSVLYRSANDWCPAPVYNAHQAPRSYILRTGDGSLSRRNRKQIVINTSTHISDFGRQKRRYTRKVYEKKDYNLRPR